MQAEAERLRLIAEKLREEDAETAEETGQANKPDNVSLGRSRRFGAPDFPRVTNPNAAPRRYRRRLRRRQSPQGRNVRRRSRSPRSTSVGTLAVPNFEPGQLTWLRQRYHVAVKANPLLKKHDAAVPYVQKLAMTEFGIIAGRNTVLDQIIRLVLRS